MVRAVAAPHTTPKLFLGGLTVATTEETLERHFSPYGKLVDVVVMRYKDTGKPRGFGFVEYVSIAAAEDAMAATPHRVDGREIDVKRATARHENSGPDPNPPKL